MKLIEMLKVFGNNDALSIEDEKGNFLSYGSAQEIVAEGYTDILPKEVVHIYYEQGRTAIVRVKY